MAKIKLDSETSFHVRKGDGYFYVWFNPDTIRKTNNIKTVDSLGTLYQHSLEDIKKSLDETIQKSSSNLVFNPVNTRSFSGLFSFILACVCSIAVEASFFIIRTAYRICNRTQIYPASFFARHTVDLTGIARHFKHGLFHIISSPNMKSNLWRFKPSDSFSCDNNFL